jgi:hypothetical protein
MIDFKQMKAAAKSKQESQGMLAVILGSSGSGKSTVCGTTGRPTLVIHTKDESHGPTSASTFNEEVVGYCINQDEEGNELSADDAMERMYALLTAEDLSDNFGCVVFDSLSSIDLLIKKTSEFFEFCKTDKGKHSAYRETEAVLNQIQKLVTSTDSIRARGVHVLFTLAAHIKSMEADGTVETVAPVLSSYGCAEGMPRLFPAVLYVAPVVVDGEKKRAFLFNTQVKRESKDLAGRTTKMLNFSPRLAGIPDAEMPEMLPADFVKLQEFIKSVKG